MIFKNKFKLFYVFVIAIIYICNLGLANVHYQVNFVSGESYIYPNTATNVYEVVASDGNLPYKSYTWLNATPISSNPETATTAKNNTLSTGSMVIKCTVKDQSNKYAYATKTVSVYTVESISSNCTAIIKGGNNNINLTANLNYNLPANGEIEWQRKFNNGGWSSTISGETYEDITLLSSENVGKYKYQARVKGNTGDDGWVESSDLFVITAVLYKVSFDSVAAEKCHTIYKDNGDGAYSTPHWYDSDLDGDANDIHPICFTKANTMKATVKWHIEPEDVVATIKVKGDGPGNLDFLTTTENISGNELIVNNYICSNPFEDNIDIIEPMTIKWSFSLDNGQTWQNAESANNVYVTLGDPESGCTLYHTTVHIGCKNADGINDEDALIAAIWPAFSGRNVKRFDGTPLKYYASTAEPYNVDLTAPDLAGLLDIGSGRCGAFYYLIKNVFDVQGSDKVSLYHFTDTKPYLNDAINYYKTTHDNRHPSQDGYVVLKDIFYIKYWNLTVGEANPTDLNGSPAQGNTDPIAIFGDHALAEIGDKIYDPSYGGDPHDGINNWKNDAIVGYGAQFYKADKLASDFYLYVGEKK